MGNDLTPSNWFVCQCSVRYSGKDFRVTYIDVLAEGFLDAWNLIMATLDEGEILHGISHMGTAKEYEVYDNAAQKIQQLRREDRVVRERTLGLNVVMEQSFHSVPDFEDDDEITLA